MQVYPTTGKLRLARATPYFNSIVAPASGERAGLRGHSERIFPHPNPLPEGEGTLIQQHCPPLKGGISAQLGLA
jgi:hypothetical protein